jgi:predicted ester cyclase
MSIDPTYVAQAVFQAADANDLDTLRTHPGLFESVQYIPGLWTAFPDLRHTIDQQYIAGNVDTTVATARGTHRGVLFGLPPTGRSVTFTVIAVDTVVDGKIVLHYGLPDWLAILGAIGALPALAPAGA